jgi:hypothetical protein
MNVTALFSRAWKLCQKHLIVLVPLFIPTVIAALVVPVMFVAQTSKALPVLQDDPARLLEEAAIAFVPILLISFAYVLVSLVMQGMSIVMAQEIHETGTTTLSSGWANTKNRIIPLTIAAALFSILFAIGSLLFVLPGLAVGFFLIFLLPEVVVAEKDPIPALRGSVRLVARNRKIVAIIFLLLFALGMIVSLISSILALIPVVGAIASAVISTAFTGFSVIFILQVYQELAGDSPVGEDVEV